MGNKNIKIVEHRLECAKRALEEIKSYKASSQWESLLDVIDKLKDLADTALNDIGGIEENKKTKV